MVLTDHLVRRDPAPGSFLAPRAESHDFHRGPLRLFDPLEMPEPQRSWYLGVAAITAGSKISDHNCISNNASPAYAVAPNKYIGLRVKRNGPVSTSAVGVADV